MRYYKGKADRDTAEIVLIASGEGRVIGEGSSMWMGPNAANGQVNIGEFSALGSLNGANLIFNQDDCKVSAKLKGRVLEVKDNDMWGGVRATFTGQYRRK